MFGVTATLYEELINRGQNILIAGTTGSGKSVLLNGIINSILYENPAKHQMVLIDLKIVEFSQFKNTAHCISCATSKNEAEMALAYVYDLIKMRLKNMEKRGIKNFDGTKIHLIIDEMAELMLDSKDCAKLLQRICQIGRAAGVQVICATQCPLSSVIPTKIKVNFNIVIGLHTRTAQDSRNILGETGCEKLPMYGQALILRPGQEIVKEKIQMIPEEWLQRIIEYRTRR